MPGSGFPSTPERAGEPRRRIPQAAVAVARRCMVETQPDAASQAQWR